MHPPGYQVFRWAVAVRYKFENVKVCLDISKILNKLKTIHSFSKNNALFKKRTVYKVVPKFTEKSIICAYVEMLKNSQTILNNLETIYFSKIEKIVPKLTEKVAIFENFKVFSHFSKIFNYILGN